MIFQIGDALLLPFEDGTFDAAFENNVLVHLSQACRAGGERKCMRVLKPGGFFAARDVDVEPWCGAIGPTPSRSWTG